MLMILGGAHATVVPPGTDKNRRLPVLIAIRPALNWDHHRCSARKNITHQSAGLALATLVVMQQSGRYRRECGHSRESVDRSLLTHSVTSPSSIAALRKDHSIISSARDCALA